MTWGQGETGNLALGDNMRPLTTLQAHFIEPQKVGGFFRFLGQADVHLFYGFLEGDRSDRARARGLKDYDDAGLIGIRADFSPTSYFTFGLSRLSMLGGKGNGLDGSDWGHWLYGRNDDADQDRWDDIAGGDFRLSLPVLPSTANFTVKTSPTTCRLKWLTAADFLLSYQGNIIMVATEICR